MKWWPVSLLVLSAYAFVPGTASGRYQEPLDHYYASNRLLDCRSVAEARNLYAPDASIRWTDVRRMNRPARTEAQVVEVTLVTSRLATADRRSPEVTRDRVTCWFQEEQLVALHLNGRDLLGVVGDGGHLVFFNWDQHAIRTDGFQVIQAVVDQVRAGSYESILAIGHTDRSGDPGYNMRLSQQRALVVKAALQSMGIPETMIRADWKGETMPLVPTPPGVREERNRRVEIILEP
jgi:outer membrane protein OmpA-like peptidoglycan-associated protein